MPSGSGLPQKRTFDNHSHIVTMNHLERLDSVNEVGLNIAYHNDLIRQEGSSESDQFVSDEQRLLTSETMVSETKMNNLNIQARYNLNASNGFIADVLKFDTEWNSDDVQSNLSSGERRVKSEKSNTANNSSFFTNNSSLNRVRQHFHRPQWSISNTFNTIRNFGKHTLDLHFSVGYAQRPNTLSVVIDSLFDNSQSNYVQDITSRNIAGNFYTKYDFHFGDFALSYGVTANASLHGIKTDLNEEGRTKSEESNASTYSSLFPLNSSLTNDLWYNNYEFVFGQYYKFEKLGWRLSLGCPLELYTQTLYDRVQNDKHSYTHFLVTPSFSASYEWHDWSGKVDGSYSKTVGDPGGIYSGYIMNNYRSFQRSYVDQLSETNRVAASATISYRSALTATFFNIKADYTHTRDNQIYGYQYHGATSIIQAIDKPTTTDQYVINFDGSKGFDWLMATLRAFGGYRYSKSERLISSYPSPSGRGQGWGLYPFHSHTVSIGGGGTITPLPFLNFVLSAGYAWNMSGTDDDAWKGTTVRSATYRLNANIYITKAITVTATVEDNYNNLTVKNRHAWFGDMSVKWKLKHVDLELQLNNVFDQRQYTRVNYSGLDIYSQTSQLRPMNVIGTIRFKLL